MFSVVNDIAISSSDFNSDLHEVNLSDFQGKASFNPNPAKQVQEVRQL